MILLDDDDDDADADNNDVADDKNADTDNNDDADNNNNAICDTILTTQTIPFLSLRTNATSVHIPNENLCYRVRNLCFTMLKKH